MVDSKQIIQCPACGKEMEKVYVESAKVYVDVCSNGCGGIYFDNREFYLFDEPSEDISEITEVLKNKTFEPADTEQDRFCPHCGNKMVKNFTSFSKEVATDDCYNCGGKFLDYGELEKARAQFESAEARARNAESKILQSPIYYEATLKDADKNRKQSIIKNAYDAIFNKLFFG